jgi:hypothetical protein
MTNFSLAQTIAVCGPVRRDAAFQHAAYLEFSTLLIQTLERLPRVGGFCAGFALGRDF